MFNKTSVFFSSIVLAQSFTIFPEYFIATSSIYLLITLTLITYNTYGLIVQKSLSNCLALICLMSCCLVINDDLICLNYVSFHNTVINDYMKFFSQFIVCLFSSIFFYFIADFLKDQKLVSFEYLLIVFLAILGLVLLCGTNDLLTAYLAIELTSLSSYVLAAFKKTSNYSVEAGIKYFVTGAISSAFFLLGSSFIYFLSGSVNLLDIWDLLSVNRFFPNIHAILQNHEINLETVDSLLAFEFAMCDFWYELITYFSFWTYWLGHAEFFNFSFLEYGLTLVLFSLFIKLALAPFHLWSLDVYEGSPSNSTFFFAVLTKLSIFVFLVRLCYIAFTEFNNTWQFYSLIIGVLSVFIGSFGGLKQKRFKTLLAYSSTSHMGYSLLAFSSGQYLGVQMIFFYLLIYMISSLCVWFIFILLKLKTNETNIKYNKELGDFSLLKNSNLSLALAMGLVMFSIAGIPPLIGFFSKINIFLSIIKSGFYRSLQFYLVALLSILCSVISTFYYIRVIKILFFENSLVSRLYCSITSSKTIILGILLFLLVFLFTNPTIIYLLTYKVVFSSTLLDCYK